MLVSVQMDTHDWTFGPKKFVLNFFKFLMPLDIFCLGVKGKNANFKMWKFWIAHMTTYLCAIFVFSNKCLM